MPIQWRKEMAVDEATIDEDHRFLIDIVNKFEVAISVSLRRGPPSIPLMPLGNLALV